MRNRKMRAAGRAKMWSGPDVYKLGKIWISHKIILFGVPTVKSRLGLTLKVVYPSLLKRQQL